MKIYNFWIFLHMQPEKRSLQLNIMAFCPEHPKWDQNPKFTPLCEMTSILAPFIWESPQGFGADKSDYFRKINYLSVLILSGWPLRQRSRFNTLDSHFIWWLWILHLIFSTKERSCQGLVIKEKFHKLVTASYHSMLNKKNRTINILFFFTWPKSVKK